MSQFSLEILPLLTEKDKHRFRSLVNEINPSHPFYRPELILKNEEKEMHPRYFLFSNQDMVEAIMVFYLRPIEIKEKESGYFDVISPYGYSGPLFKNDSECLKKEFWKKVDQWYQENKVISEFIRFSLNDNHLNYTGTLVPSLKNVKGEIIEETEQWSSFRPKVRNNYRRAEKNQLKCKVYYKNITEAALMNFYDIYTSTMERNEASEQYFYSFEFFSTYVKNNSQDCALAIVTKDKVPVSAELILISDKTLYSFLGGTLSNYFFARPNDFLKIEVMKWARSMKFDSYVLGGGRADNDGLYTYKKTFFPKDRDVNFYTGRKIVNKKVYDLLVRESICSEIEKDIETEKPVSFFPLYRYVPAKKSKTMSVKILESKTEWDSTLKKIGDHDFYHTYDYHQLSKQSNERAVLFVFSEHDVLIAIPFIIRPIENHSLYDATSVYGYAGPISMNIAEDWDNSTFKNELIDFFKKEKIVSVFSRLNPYINNQETILKDVGDIKKLGPVVNIDLTKDLDEQRTLFSRTTKRYLNKIGKLCTTEISDKEEDILKFIDLYYENMDRVNAKKRYYFDKDYFFSFLKSSGFKTDVIFAILNETKEIISAAMMVKTNKIIQYHISGTLNEYLNMTPIRLLIDKTRISGTEEGYTYFNLGGGLGSQDDSLLRFKSSFSKDFKDFKIWKLICNQEMYDELVTANEDASKNMDSDFFPLYRFHESK